MNPNTTLAELRRLASEILADSEADHTDAGVIAEKGIELAELVVVIDSWIAIAKGFLPEDWKPTDGREMILLKGAVTAMVNRPGPASNRYLCQVARSYHRAQQNGGG